MLHSQITYFVNSTEDLIISRLGSEIIMGQVSYEDWVCEDFSGKAYECFHSRTDNAKGSIFDYPFRHGKWTKKIPLPWKNFHRKLWGLEPLKEENPLPEWYLDWESSNAALCPTPENAEIRDIPESFHHWVSKNSVKRQHWYGNREMFKTFVFAATTRLVVEELVPLLEDSDFVIKLKCW